MNNPLVIAHRGGNFDEEDLFRNIERSIDIRVDGIEIDLTKIKDEIILFHYDGTSPKEMLEQSYVEISERFKREGRLAPLTFSNFIERATMFPRKVLLKLDIKTSDDGDVDERLIDTVKRYGYEYIITHFGYAHLANPELRRKTSERIRIYKSSGIQTSVGVGYWRANENLERAREVGADIVSYTFIPEFENDWDDGTSMSLAKEYGIRIDAFYPKKIASERDIRKILGQSIMPYSMTVDDPRTILAYISETKK